MRSRLITIMVSFSIGFGMAAQPGQAQLADTQTARVAEAIRQVSLSTGVQIDGLYSDWQVNPENITRWSKKCTGQALSPQTFGAEPAQARKIVVCVLRDVMRDEYQASQNNEILAVRRTAAWWLTGVAGRYASSDIAPYAQKVVDFYQQTNLAANQPPPKLESAQKPELTKKPELAKKPELPQNPVYERYIQAANSANQRQALPIALLYFKRALDERPNDAVAMQAILTIEAQMKASPAKLPSPQSPPTPVIPGLK